MQPVFFAEAGQLCGLLLLADQRITLWAQAQQDVLQRRHRRNQHKVLMHHADAQGDGLAGSGDLHRLALPDDLPLLRMVQPIENVHQGGFSRAVFSQQSMDLPRRNGEIDVIHRPQAREVLHHTPHFQ
ncbi:hypothetical protein SDC9_98641 [bioreactor metagenome]|uniref:Uncharacterized protein n=1 Tax=bioreactor metagenome TaxID=1076179 RepID=A0A645AFE3_9ZZZZ